MLVVRWSEFSAGLLDLALRSSGSYCNLWDTVCSQLLGVHALSGYDTVSYPFGKGKASAMKTLKTGNFPGLGEESAHANLMEVGQQFFAALYGQPTGTSMTQARYNLFLYEFVTVSYISHMLVFLYLVKLTINKTNGCLFDCQLCELGNLSKFQQF